MFEKLLFKQTSNGNTQRSLNCLLKFIELCLKNCFPTKLQMVILKDHLIVWKVRRELIRCQGREKLGENWLDAKEGENWLDAKDLPCCKGGEEDHEFSIILFVGREKLGENWRRRRRSWV